MPGVIRTEVGYSGGTKKNPTYRSLGDHSESILIEYDPARISYSQLLDAFWKGHDPTSRSWSTQYKSAIFYMNSEQKELAEKSMAEHERAAGERFATEILPFEHFYTAEGYHQKHALKRFPHVMKELEEVYKSDDAVMSSTAAARINGYVGGHGTCDSLRDSLTSLDLPDKTLIKILEDVCGKSFAASCPVPGRKAR